MDHQADIVIVPSMDYIREHVKICLNSIINVEHVLYLIFGEEFKKTISNGSDLLVDHQEDVVMFFLFLSKS